MIFIAIIGFWFTPDEKKEAFMMKNGSIIGSILSDGEVTTGQTEQKKKRPGNKTSNNPKVRRARESGSLPFRLESGC